MRRSVREALVGFSLLAAIASGLGLWLWLKGISLRRDVWTIRASFADAAGLASRSPVYFRGVPVGNVRGVRVTGAEVVADLEITDPNLRLSRPVVARVGLASLLGGDAVVSLLSTGKPLPENAPGPRDRNCEAARMVCDRGRVAGVTAPSLDTVTESVQKILDDAERQRLVPQMVTATRTFEKSAREAEKLTREGQEFVTDARGLITNANRALVRADPILRNLDAASADAARATRQAALASKDVRAVTSSLSTPESIADLQKTLTNARQLTENWKAVGGDVRQLTADPKFIDGIRSVAVGLGSFFEELYPAQVDAARQRDARDQGVAPATPEAGQQSGALGPDSLPPLPPPPRKQRVLSGPEQMEADRVRRGAGLRPR